MPHPRSERCGFQWAPISQIVPELCCRNDELGIGSEQQIAYQLDSQCAQFGTRR